MHWATTSCAFCESICALGALPRAASMADDAQPASSIAAAIATIDRMLHPQGKKSPTLALPAPDENADFPNEMPAWAGPVHPRPTTLAMCTALRPPALA